MQCDTDEIEIVKDLNEISQTAAEMIIRQSNEARSSAKPFTIALSGGSTPRRLYQYLNCDPSVRSRLPWNNLHFFWGDERHVPPEDPQSNYRMACETLFASGLAPAQNIHRVHAEESDAATAAKKYEQELLSFFKPATGQLPRFDCVLLGIGSDGHTASLFPGTSALQEKRRLVAANWIEKFQTHRITITAPVLNNADLVIFLVSGKEKAEVLQEILEGDYLSDLFPAQLIRPVHGRLLWLVDQAAAGCLNYSIKHLN